MGGNGSGGSADSSGFYFTTGNRVLCYGLLQAKQAFKIPEDFLTRRAVLYFRTLTSSICHIKGKRYNFLSFILSCLKGVQQNRIVRLTFKAGVNLNFREKCDFLLFPENYP